MDPRFEAVRSDPRFAAPAKKKHASETLKDDRFRGLLDDPDFSNDVAKKRAVDKRGRKVSEVQPDEKPAKLTVEKGQRPALAAPQAKAQGGKGKAPVKSAEAAAAEAKVHAARWARARGLTHVPSSSDEDDSDEGDKKGDEGGHSSSSRSSGSESDASLVSEELSADSADEPLTDEEEINEQDLIDEWGIGVMAANPEEQVPLAPEATSRLALVDMDWDVVRAVDILAALNSFKTKTGRVNRVTVYPSDYGLQRMAEEAAHGPKALCPPKKKRQPSTGSSGSSSEDIEDEEEGEGGGGDKNDSSSDSGDEVDKLRIRMYEQSKLRYYYAVAECDSAATASALYDACDGAELGRGTGGGCKLDLRFVPKETSFEGRAVRDTATGVPFGYAPPTAFSSALQHTKPQLTWDADDAGRKKLLNRKLSEAELKDEDFRAYLASSSGDDEEEDGEEPTVYGGAQEGTEKVQKADKEQAASSLRDRYRALLLGSGGPPEDDEESEGKGVSKKGKKGKAKVSSKANKAWGAASSSSGKGSSEDSEGQEGKEAPVQPAAARKGTKDTSRAGLEMEVTFVPGLEGLKHKIEEKRKSREAKQAETVWETYLRRKKEKAKLRKRKSRGGGSSSSSSEDDRPVAAGGGKGKKGKPGTDQLEAAAAGAADDADEQVDPFDDPFFNDNGPGELVLSGSDEEQQPRGAKGKHPVGKGKAQEAGGKGDKKGRPSKKGGGAVDANKAAELELLLLDDEQLRAGKLRRDSQQAERQEGPAGKGKKSKRRKAKRSANSDDEAAEDGMALATANFKPNLADPRFADMMTNQHFALDPTDPRFRSGGGSALFAKQLKEARAFQQQRKAAAEQQVAHDSGGSKSSKAAAVGEQARLQGAIETGNRESHVGGARSRQQLELKSMVTQLKRKQQQQQHKSAPGISGDGSRKRSRES